ncbi:hypothetical protein PG996_007422 [Apiospora saccharicola]|uniref:NAD(P)-binding protein n=1 Tax=Apiospora saccharicola TaxID=335842 RepID=A0ABR1VAS9_9PEZI
MVKFSDVVESNAHFARGQHEGRVCVFAGATSGIGYGTLRRLITMMRSSTFYVLGRNESSFATQLDELRASAPTNKITFVECQLSLIRDVDAACKSIAAAEKKVDLLCMSPGGMPFQGAVYTDEEGLEVNFTVSYYSRARILARLLPLLHQSPQPRVLSILNGTKEKRINEGDIGLKEKWSIVSLVNHTTICTSLAFDYLSAAESPRQTVFIHATPGLVHTGVPRTRRPSRQKLGFFWWALTSAFQVVSGWIIVYFGRSLPDAAERHAYLLTTDSIGPGSWRTTRDNDVLPDNEALHYYHERSFGETIWNHTVRVCEAALGRSSS